MAKTIGLLLLLLLLFDCSQALIIPQELPSILSLVYSNIPPVKKGKDSRYGVGFRLGEHADFQLLFEFGPQTETQKIGGVNANKRQVDQNDSPKSATKKRNSTNQEATSWLSNWSYDMNMAQRKKKKALPNAKKSTTTTTTSTTTTTVRTVPLISTNVLKQLSQLYKLQPSASTEKSTIAVSKSIEVTTKTPGEQKKITQELMDVYVE